MFTGEAILNHAALPTAMCGWLRRWIEYGFECACPETTIYLQPLLRQELAEIAQIYRRGLIQKLRGIADRK